MPRTPRRRRTPISNWAGRAKTSRGILFPRRDSCPLRESIRGTTGNGARSLVGSISAPLPRPFLREIHRLICAGRLTTVCHLARNYHFWRGADPSVPTSRDDSEDNHSIPKSSLVLAVPDTAASNVCRKRTENSTSGKSDRTSTPSNRVGQFVISLDFELYWGVRHMPSVTRYVKNLIGARTAIPALLALFREYRIHATWATVGFLFFDSTDTLLSCAPPLRPNYEDARLSPYADLPPNEARETSDSIFFAPSVISHIAETENQEIATHSFSHYYCLENGQNKETFRQDLLAARAAARQLGIRIRTLVFPKNQCRCDYLSVCSEVDILAYRGNPGGWLYRAAADDGQTFARRLGRLLDAYIPLSGSNCSRLPELKAATPVNIPASRYLRPYTPILHSLDPLRLWRIKRDLTTAAKEGRLYHLWWHPHNFGVNLSSNLAFLRQILEHFRSLRERYGIESLNVGEAAARCMAAP